MTLEAIVTALANHYGWEDLGRRINIRCFTSDPSVASSLKFLRKTPWAREKVESLYLFMAAGGRRQTKRRKPAAWLISWAYSALMLADLASCA